MADLNITFKEVMKIPGAREKLEAVLPEGFLDDPRQKLALGMRCGVIADSKLIPLTDEQRQAMKDVVLSL